ncbi:hypothetical protein Tco_0898603 [Tanacetum coccineum]
MGYHFYNPHENKVSVARYAELFEKSLKFTRSSGSLTLLKASGSIVQRIENEAKTTDGTQPANVAVPHRLTWDPHTDVVADVAVGLTVLPCLTADVTGRLSYRMLPRGGGSATNDCFAGVRG